MGGRQHWVMLIDEATKYKNSFFLKKKNEQIEPTIDWITALKARHEIQVKIIRCDQFICWVHHPTCRRCLQTTEPYDKWGYTQ